MYLAFSWYLYEFGRLELSQNYCVPGSWRHQCSISVNQICENSHYRTMNRRCCLLLLLALYSAAALEGITTAAKIDRYAWLPRPLIVDRKTQDEVHPEGNQESSDRNDEESYQSMFLRDENGYPVENQVHEELKDESVLIVPTTGRLRVRGNASMWLIPILGCFVSYASFGQMSRLFLMIAQWASSNTWIPTSRDDIDLQANVVVSSGAALAMLVLGRLTIPD
jgi:hypothetical protein